MVELRHGQRSWQKGKGKQSFPYRQDLDLIFASLFPPQVKSALLHFCWILNLWKSLFLLFFAGNRIWSSLGHQVLLFSSGSLENWQPGKLQSGEDLLSIIIFHPKAKPNLTSGSRLGGEGYSTSHPRQQLPKTPWAKDIFLHGKKLLLERSEIGGWSCQAIKALKKHVADTTACKSDVAASGSGFEASSTFSQLVQSSKKKKSFQWRRLYS